MRRYTLMVFDKGSCHNYWPPPEVTTEVRIRHAALLCWDKFFGGIRRTSKPKFRFHAPKIGMAELYDRHGRCLQIMQTNDDPHEHTLAGISARKRYDNRGPLALLGQGV